MAFFGKSSYLRNGARLLVMIIRSHNTPFRLVPKSTTLDDLERPLRTLLQKHESFEAHHENLNEYRPRTILSEAKNVAQ